MAGYSTVEFHILYSETPHAHRFTAKLLACAEHQLELLQWFSLLHGLTLCFWILLKIYQQFLNEAFLNLACGSLHCWEAGLAVCM